MSHKNREGRNLMFDRAGQQFFPDWTCFYEDTLPGKGYINPRDRKLWYKYTPVNGKGNDGKKRTQEKNPLT